MKNAILKFWAFALNVLCAFVAISVMSLFKIEYWIGLSAGVAILITSALLSVLVKAKFYPLAIFLNGIASGFAISSLFTFLGAFPPVWQLALSCLGAAALFAAFCLLCKIRFIKKHHLFFICLYALIVLGVEIVCAIFVEPLIFYFSMFMILPVVSYSIVHNENVEGEKRLKHFMFASFSFLIVAVIVVLAVITEGDGLDSLVPVDKEKKKGAKNKLKKN